jgi:DNA-binding transcriptional LysR family regulator
MNLRTFDLNLLRVLAALLETGAVSEAARRLGLSQPATSAALARLRRHLDDPILVRNGNRMEPTRFAETLRPRLERILAEIAEALSAPDGFDPSTTARTFRIAANDYASIVLVAPLMARLRAIAPKTNLDVMPLEDRFEDRLAADDYDVAIRDRWSMQSAQAIETLYTEDYICVARADHPRLSKKPTLAQFLAEQHALVSPRGVVPGVVDCVLDDMGVSRRVTLALPHFAAIPAAIAETDLIATLARRVASRFARTYALRLFAPPFPVPGFEVAMAWRKRSDADSGAAWLRGELRSVASVFNRPDVRA